MDPPKDLKKMKQFRRFIQDNNKETPSCQTPPTRPSSTIAPKKIEKARRLEEEEVEVFEVVNNSRPARCNPFKQKKLKWKTDKDEGEKSIRDEEMERAHDDADNSDPPSPKVPKDGEKKLPLDKENAVLSETVARLRRRIQRRDDKIATLKKEKGPADSAMKFPKRKEGSHDPVSETDEPPIDPFDDLALSRANKKQLRSTIKKMREELTTTRKSASKMKTNEKMNAKDEEEDEAIRPIARKVAELIKRNQLAEKSLNMNESDILARFFASGSKKPDNKTSLVLDKAISGALDMIAHGPEDIDDVIDNQMRNFVIQRSKAKRLLIEMMLNDSNLVPVGWRSGTSGRFAVSNESRSKSPSSDAGLKSCHLGPKF